MIDRYDKKLLIGILVGEHLELYQHNAFFRASINSLAKMLPFMVNGLAAGISEPIICQYPDTCDRKDHAATAGGTLCHLPPGGVIVPGLFDHGVPSDIIARMMDQNTDTQIRNDLGLDKPQ